MQPNNNYDISFLEKVTVSKFGFNLFSMPNYSWKYTDIIFEEMTALLVRQMAHGIGSFVDIGAHYGFYSVLVGKTNPNVKILAFEPIKDNFKVLSKNLMINNVSANTFMSAVSDFEGRSEFQISTQSSQSGFIANPDEDVLKEVEVDVVRLDKYRDLIEDDPVIVKIDTEGNELKVLSGMEKLIEDIDDIRLIIEFNPNCLKANQVNPEALLEKIEGLGFDVFFICDTELQYKKYNSQMKWEDLMGERTYRNLYCVKKQQSLNICFFLHSSQLGGSERSLKHLIDGLTQDYGTLCTVVLPSQGPLGELLLESGVSTLTAPVTWWCAIDEIPSENEINRQYGESYDWLNQNLQLLNEINPDVILTNSLVIPWGALAALLLKRPHVWLVNEFGVLDHQLKFLLPFDKVLDFVDKASNKIITCSQAVKNELFPNIDPEKAFPIYRHIHIPPEVYSPDQSTETHFQHPDAFHLIMPGTVRPSKGQEDAVRGVVELKKNRDRQVELIIVGNAQPNYRNFLQKIIDDYDLNNYIHIVPFQESVLSLVMQADALLVCSKMEAFGRVTLEGQLLKIPVIATNTGGTLELITDEETGLLYTPGDYLDLANQIEKLMDKPDLRKKLSDNGYQFVHNTFTKENFSGKYQKLLLELKKAGDIEKTGTSWLLIKQYKNLFSQKNLEIHKLKKKLLKTEEEAVYYSLSKSWRITRPFRKIMKIFKGDNK